MATTLWVRDPPSDQDWNAYEVPPNSWGDGALIEFVDPLMTVAVKGAVCVSDPTTTCSPVGLVARVRFTVCGWRSTPSLPVREVLSVAVS